MIRTPSQFVTAVRQLANLENDPIVTDEEILDRVNEGLSALYDILVGTYEHYQVSTYDFTLAGGVGANATTLPTDFYKDISLDRDPTQSRPETVHRLSSWVDRNRARWCRAYTVMGNQLVVQPANNSSGSYRLTYTPLPPVMADPVTAATTYTSTPINRTIPGADAVDTSGPLADWFFGSAPFTDVPIPAALYVQHASNTGNNGIHIIQSSSGPRNVTTSKVGVTDETFSDDVTAQLLTGPFDSVSFSGSNTWTFNHADFTTVAVGSSVAVAGSQGSDGTYTVTAVLDSHNIQTDGAAHFETFADGVTVTYQPNGTVPSLPQIFVPWFEYVQVSAAIALKDKIEQDSTSLQIRRQNLHARITAAASNRMEEGGQVPMRSGLDHFDDIFPWR